VRDLRVVEVGGRRVGLARKLPGDNVAQGAAVAAEWFEGPVDVVVFASTHVPVTAVSGGMLFVNPGSPTLAAAPMVAVLDLDGPVVSVTLIPIER
jgi:predicted phosphodiesterase